MNKTELKQISESVLFPVTLIAFLAFFVFPAAAATITVNTAADENGTGVNCSLREAVQSANTDSAFGGCTMGSGSDSINFDVLFATPQTIALSGGQINVSSVITIFGPGANMLTIQNTQAASTTSRDFFVNISGNLSLSGVTLTGANLTAANGGGGIAISGGAATLTNVVITGNTVDGYGGGISLGTAASVANVINCTISNNTANGTTLGGGGGGIDNAGTLVMTNSTVSGNTKNGSTSNGGGVYSFSGNVTITNSTITNNQSNTASSASGVYRNGGTVTVRNTIIAANQNNAVTPDVAGAFTSSGYNLIGNLGTATGFTGTADQTGVSNANAGLGPLADNGGTTLTHALLTGSFAIDKGSNFAISTDQRSFTRPYDNPAIPNAAGGNGTDIGAFEVQMPSAAGISISGRVLGENQRGLSKAVVYLTKQSGETQTVLTNPFGYYQFTDLEAGQTYILNVFSKQYQFDPLVVTATDNIVDLNFMPQSTGGNY